MIAPAFIIAAGGEGRRLGGDKPLRILGERSLLAHAIARAAVPSDCLAIAVRDPAQIGPTDWPILCDLQPDRGPISALDSAFRFASEQGRSAVILIGCDQPFLPTNLVAKLTEALGDHLVAMPVSRSKHQPLAALWRVDQVALTEYLAQGGRALWRFAQQRGVIHVEWPIRGAHDPFANINDPAALAEAERPSPAPHFRRAPTHGAARKACHWPAKDCRRPRASIAIPAEGNAVCSINCRASCDVGMVAAGLPISCWPSIRR